MKIANKFQFLGLLLGAVMFMSPALAQMVTFKTLDKVTAKISSLEAEVGLPTVLGPLTITVRTCKTTPPEEPPETSVYLEIDEKSFHLFYLFHLLKVQIILLYHLLLVNFLFQLNF